MKPTRKPKKHDSSSKLVLQEIIGLTTKNANGLGSATCSSKCFYLAGCVIVVYDVDSGTQSHLLVRHRMPKPLSCVAVSRDGRFVAAGESGNLSAVLVWDSETMGFVSELRGHLYGVECMAYSPDGEHLVSAGGYIYLWDWRRSILVAKLKASSTCPAVTSVNFSSDGKFIATAGNKHLKFWTVGALPKTRSRKGAVSLEIHGKPLDLGPHKGSSFVSVIPANWNNSNSRSIEQTGEHYLIYALTDSGVLCLINSRFLVKKSVDLKVEKGFALSASDQLIACACSKGVVQLFSVKTLDYAGKILYSEAKNWHGESQTSCHIEGQENEIQLAPSPDAVACQFTSMEKLVVIYTDRRLYIWDIHDVEKVTRYSMVISHSACIWDIKNLSCGHMHNPSVACVARGCSGGVSFATCSADGTIRLWDLALQLHSSEVTMDSNSSNIKPIGKTHLASAGFFERDLVEAGVSTIGFRSLAISQDGKYLAAGDCEGSLHIYDLRKSEYTCLKDAHDAEILSLSFSFGSVRDVNSKVSTPCLLASGGRDRTIHLYNVERNFDVLESIDDHSAAVTSVKLPCDGYKILSCSADRSLVFRDVGITEGEVKISRSHHQVASYGTVYDMAIDPTSEIVVTVGQDKKINIFDIAAGKLTKSFRQEKDFGEPIKVIMDPSCNYLACSYSNRTICIFDFINGQLVAQGIGHGEVVTGLIFLPNCKHIVSVGGDGCIFVWKVPSCMASRMRQRVEENVGALSPKSLVEPVSFHQIMLCIKEELQKQVELPRNLKQVEETLQSEGKASPWTSSFKFSVSRLPNWARAKVTSSDIVTVNRRCTSTENEKQETETLPNEDAGSSSSACLEFQTPSHDFGSGRSCLSSLCEGSPDTNDTETSTVQDRVVSGSDVDKQWHTIYNVCLDLMNSPEIQDLKDVKVPLSSTILFPDPTQIQSNLKCPGGFVKDSEQFQLDETQRQKIEDANTSFLGEHSELFKQYFGNLSTTEEVKPEKSAQRRRYSSQYVLRRDYFGNKRWLLDASAQNSVAKTLTGIEESDPKVTLDNLQKGSPEEHQNTDFTTQDKISEILPDSNRSSTNAESCECPSKENSLRMESTETSDQHELGYGETQQLDKITACHDALRGLNTAARNFKLLFSELASNDFKNEILSGFHARLCNEAAELLPSISEKIDAATKLIQSRNN